MTLGGGTNLYSAHACTHESSIRAQLVALWYNQMMIRRSYSGPSERAKSRELGPTRSCSYLSEWLVPSPLHHSRDE